jgi:NADPH-dependent glutamate synthase beta subunit-like oxidoreductase
VVLALGQQTDSSFLREVPGIAFSADGMVVVDAGMMTDRPGIFAGGDMAPGDRTVTAAVGHGKKAARRIDAWLGGQVQPVVVRHPTVGFDQLNLPIYADAPRAVQSELPLEGRVERGFAETTSGLSETEARHEARRCLSCGNCFECDQCYAACPEQAIVKLGPGRPCHAIDMIPEPASATSEQPA